MKMRVLARSRFNYSCKRLRAEAKMRGFSLTVNDPEEYDIVLGRQSPMLFRRGQRVDKCDVVVPRLGASITNHGLAVVTQFEMMGIPVMNGSVGTQNARNKLRCIQLLSQHDIDIPRTVIIRHPDELHAAIKEVGNFPVVLKLLSGTQGIGVMLVENMSSMESTLNTLWSLGQDILIQECVKESLGRDVRMVVVGNQVVAAMRRQARIGEFRSNIHRGGIATALDIPQGYVELALQSSRIVGLSIAGVDLLESYSGPKVIEVNASPGLEGIETCTHLNVAGAILDFAAEQARGN